jgi:hypothetical protein
LRLKSFTITISQNTGHFNPTFRDSRYKINRHYILNFAGV